MFHLTCTLERYKVVEELLGKSAASYETFRRWTKILKNGPEETGYTPRSGTPTSATDESVLECSRSISCVAVTEEFETSPASVCPILTNSWGK